MFLELIATFVAGFAAAGIMMVINRSTGGRLPKWLTPVAAGAAMIAATISSEYSWYNRTANSLPEGLVIAQTVEGKALYRPWTYAVPYVERFVAVDVGTARRNEAQPGLVLVDLIFFGRWQPVRQLAVLFDCAQNRQTLVPDTAQFDDSGALIDANWGAIPADAPEFLVACGAK
ncbi:hypothetical protein [Thalassovita sp.]|uniref:hypothetical protein n=1 Tax=Thalassovita sp. TaxID=1979401 RepID=UPI002881F49B|nr:hypothetical protein [Thalassovita sp.]MDF1801480.1 hypothetical protein [Thalassovita sp.]